MNLEEYVKLIEVNTTNHNRVLCKVEGCPRTTDGGQQEACGLYTLVGSKNMEAMPNLDEVCGSHLTVDMWIRKGLL